MKDVIYLLFHLLSTLTRLAQPGGGRSVIAENLLLKQQLIIHSRSRMRAPNLRARDRTLLGFLSLFMRPRRIARAAVIHKPSTLLSFHNALKKRKYRLLYSPRGGKKRGPKCPSREVIDAIVAMKRRNPRYGCPRIAQQINLAFGLDLDKDTDRRVLAVHYKPDPGNHGPSWLTTIGHAKDSLWSVDLFRCESIILKTHWVMVVMDQYTRRIIGFAVHAGNVDGLAICRMFNDATSRQGRSHSSGIRRQYYRRYQAVSMGKTLPRVVSASGGGLSWEFARDRPEITVSHKKGRIYDSSLTDQLSH